MFASKTEFPEILTHKKHVCIFVSRYYFPWFSPATKLSAISELDAKKLNDENQLGSMVAVVWFPLNRLDSFRPLAQTASLICLASWISLVKDVKLVIRAL